MEVRDIKLYNTIKEEQLELYENYQRILKSWDITDEIKELVFDMDWSNHFSYLSGLKSDKVEFMDAFKVSIEHRLQASRRRDLKRTLDEKLGQYYKENNLTDDQENHTIYELRKLERIANFFVDHVKTNFHTLLRLTVTKKDIPDLKHILGGLSDFVHHESFLKQKPVVILNEIDFLKNLIGDLEKRKNKRKSLKADESLELWDYLSVTFKSSTYDLWIGRMVEKSLVKEVRGHYHWNDKNKWLHAITDWMKSTPGVLDPVLGEKVSATQLCKKLASHFNTSDSRPESKPDPYYRREVSELFKDLPIIA